MGWELRVQRHVSGIGNVRKALRNLGHVFAKRGGAHFVNLIVLGGGHGATAERVSHTVPPHRGMGFGRGVALPGGLVGIRRLLPDVWRHSHLLLVLLLLNLW